MYVPVLMFVIENTDDNDIDVNEYTELKSIWNQIWDYNFVLVSSSHFSV